ncbi:hypothetical protein C8R44DRAFT_867395 [Mycena epipterygia]|nr:hypothetical protein C8R44DRAFT_867395 [Mycena epipterygia]
MPSRTSPRHASAAVDLDLSAASGPSKPWRAAAHAPEPDYDDDDMDSDGDENNAALAHYEPRHLEDPWAYTFQPNDPVWVRNHDKWIKGTIFPHSKPKVGSRNVRISSPLIIFTTTPNLVYWNVQYQDSFGHKLRRNYAPLLGEIKPDTSAVRSLLLKAGFGDLF